MTVIAWDGETLAADRLAVQGGGIARPVTKIERHADVLLALTGNWDIAVQIREWFKQGAVPSCWPKEATGANRDNGGTLIVFRRGKPIDTYSECAYPLPIEATKAAFGSGRDYAEAAMYLGCTARRAVEIACHFQTDCGNGIDTLMFEQPCGQTPR